jgi:hypothetical protein
MEPKKTTANEAEASSLRVQRNFSVWREDDLKMYGRDKLWKLTNSFKGLPHEILLLQKNVIPVQWCILVPLKKGFTKL